MMHRKLTSHTITYPTIIHNPGILNRVGDSRQRTVASEFCQPYTAGALRRRPWPHLGRFKHYVVLGILHGRWGQRCGGLDSVLVFFAVVVLLFTRGVLGTPSAFTYITSVLLLSTQQAVLQRKLLRKAPSHPETGTAAAAKPLGTPVKDARRMATGGKKTVLLVEDVRVSQRVASVALSRAKFKVSSESLCSSALTFCQVCWCPRWILC